VLDPVEEPVHKRDGLVRVVLEAELAQHIPEAGESDPDAPRVEAGFTLFGERMFVSVVVEDVVEEARRQPESLCQLRPVHLRIGGKLVVDKGSEIQIAKAACSVWFEGDLGIAYD